MGLGLAAGLEVFQTSVQRDKEMELLAIGRQFRAAIGRYYETMLLNGRHDYPLSLEDLLQDQRSPGIRRHLRKVFVDPLTGKAEWGLVRVGGRIVGVHSLSEQVPIKQAGFEADDMVFGHKQKYSEWVFTYPSDLVLRLGAATGDVPLPGVTNSAPSTPVPGVEASAVPSFFKGLGGG